MSATPDTAALAGVLGETGDRERRTELSGRHPLAPDRTSGADRRGGVGRRSDRRCATTPVTCSCSCPASARSDASKRTCEGTLPERRRRAAARRRALARRAGPRPRAVRRPGRRRVVLSTDIAETSLTVAGVRVVVDSGLARAPRFDTRTGMTRLTTITTSRASADQRAGRAGRLEPGRLLPAVEQGRARHAAGPPHSPRSSEVDLAGLVLELAAWGTDVDGLAFMTAPPAKALRAGQRAARRARCARRRRAPHRDGSPDAGAAACTPGWRRCWSPSRARSAARSRRCSTSVTCCAVARTSCRAISRSVSGCSPVAVATIRPTIAPSSVSATAQPIWPAGSASGSIRRRSTSIAPVPSLLHAYPDRLAARRRPGPVPAPLRHRGLAARQRSAGARGVRRRRRPRRSPRPVADPARRRARRRRGRAPARRPGRRESFGSNGTRTATTSSSASNGGSGRCGSASRCGPPAPDPTPPHALVARVPRDRTGGARLVDHVAVAASTCRVPAPHARRTVARLEHRAPRRARVDDWLAPYLAGAASRGDLERIDLATVLRSQLPWPEGAELDELAPPSRWRWRPGAACADRLLRRRAGGARARPGPVRHHGPSDRRRAPDRAAPAVARRSADPDHGRSPGLLVRQLEPMSARSSPAATRSTSGRSIRRRRNRGD